MSKVQYNATWSHGPVSGPINGLVGAVVFTQLGRVLIKVGVGFPVWLPIGVATLGVIAAYIVGRHKKTAAKNIVFRSACWAGAGIWSTCTIIWGWSLIGGSVLIAGAVFAGLLAPVFAAYVQAPAVDVAAQMDRGMAADIRKLIIEYANLKPERAPAIEKITDWTPADAGSTWLVTGVPGSRFSWRQLRELQVDLATGLMLPDGCPVQAEPARTTQNQALLHISTRNYMKDPVDYPRDYHELTVTQDFSVGRFLDSSPTMIELYQAAGLAAGQRGGGKTVLLHNITASLVRCRDVVVWHVDLNGGGMSAPWTTPFATGEVDYPAVDWVATTPREALLMAGVALKIAKDRKAKYQALLIRENTDVLPVRPDLPLIMIIVDEGAEVNGETTVKEAQKVSAALQEVQRIGRAMCVNVFFSTLRATGDHLPAGLKKGASVAFCTRVRDASELAYVFDWHKGINPEDLTEPGQMFMQRGNGPVKMFKGYRVLPAQIIEIVLAVQHIRARVGLDKRALAIAGETYQARWERAAEFLAGLRGEIDDEVDDVDDVDDVDLDGDGDVDHGSGTGDSALDRFTAQMDTLRASRNAADRPAAPPMPHRPGGKLTADDVARMIDELERLPVTEEPTRPAATPVEQEQELERGPAARRALILQLVEDAGETGMKTEEIVRRVIAAGLANASRPQTVKEDLGKMRDAGDLTQRKGGQQVLAMWWVPRYAA